MKICFIFGKGIDGCGVTRGALLFEQWLRDAGHETIIIDFDNKQVMLRAKNSRFIGNTLRVLHSDSEVDGSVVDEVNGCDIAIFHSYPTKKQPNYIERFRGFVEKIDGPIMVMHDHGVSQTTINSVPQSGELFSYADILVPQSLNGLSAKAFTRLDPGLEGRVVENPIWIDPNSLDSFNRRYEERDKNFMYLGRTSVVKDPSMLCRVEQFFPKDWEFLLIGCEKSISMFRPKNKKPTEGELSPYISEYRDKLYYYVADKDCNYSLMNWGVTEEGKARIYIYDRYKYDWGMEKLGSSMASWCGYKLIDHANYGNRMEYTMLESFLLTLPVINRHFTTRAYSPEGKLWGDYWGPLVFGPGDEEELAEKLPSVCNNKSEWEDRTKACREIIKKFNDIEVLAPKFLDTIMELGRRKDKKDPMELMANWFPEARERRLKGDVVMSNPSCILHSSARILVDGKQEILR